MTHIIINWKNLLDNIEFINLIMCKTISYLLSSSTRSTYSLLSLIRIERLYIVLRPGVNLLKRSKNVIYFSIGTILIIFVMHIHEIWYYTIVKDSNNVTINLSQKHILLYLFIVLVHLLFKYKSYYINSMKSIKT